MLSYFSKVYAKLLSKRSDIVFNKHESHPYVVSTYEMLIRSLTYSEKFKISSFIENPCGTDKTNIYIRHDIDTLECINNISILLDIDMLYGISTGIYFRVDNASEYDIKNYFNIIQKLKHRGHEIGLHTVCYTEDNYMKKFEDETNKFYNDLGFFPNSFTVHGLGSFRHDVRMKFVESIEKSMPIYKYTFTDCSSQFRQYHYVIHDCHLDSKSNNRFICDDFINPPAMKNRNVIVLTHPCYWKPNQD